MLDAILLAVFVSVLPQPQEPVRGDGRGLATFGDRGLATFGDRRLEGFGRRGLTSFGDRSLASSGGLVQPGPSSRARSTATDGEGSSRRGSKRIANDFRPMRVAGLAGRTSKSVASLHGMTLAPAAAELAELALPAVALPVVTLDHRPALATLEARLRAEAARADARGDDALAKALGAPGS